MARKGRYGKEGSGTSMQECGTSHGKKRKSISLCTESGAKLARSLVASHRGLLGHSEVYGKPFLLKGSKVRTGIMRRTCKWAPPKRVEEGLESRAWPTCSQRLCTAGVSISASWLCPRQADCWPHGAADGKATVHLS